ncbi:flagellar basal-body rod protein FlgG [Tumebacillus sp. BK434]|uniref:flagellar hook-basal body protein n=1 Tax=Tumebacillus sp. BK434 TaxID=2512169 RepID=UPI0010487A3E|nr:flagellar hook-basal body protein [Tumebacillus sp. BK434]TCP57762.1 flagellar basal-body rod protein FlgG [Tumebacillus sp. BK434]
MRALWTSAHGMAGQQTRLDMISNNIANVNTTGYKQQDVNFKDMLYAEIVQTERTGTLAGRQTTSGIRIGHGVLAVGISQLFTQGPLQSTENLLDVAIDGENAFFEVGVYNNGVLTGNAYTRDGSFAVGYDANNTPYLTDSAGNPVLDTARQPISLAGFDLATLKIEKNGVMTAEAAGVRAAIGQLELVNIDNPDSNLEAMGNNMFALKQNAAPNALTRGAYNQPNGATLKQGFLEQSNVDMIQQMTDMIATQRAYSMNARALQTIDQMMGMANNLRNG